MTDQEINEAVARKLGWIIDKTSDHLPWYGRPGGRPESAMVRDLPDYCHSIEAAWEVVGKATSFVIYKRPKNPIYEVQMSLGVKVEIAEAATAPMAICLAFLKLEDK